MFFKLNKRPKIQRPLPTTPAFNSKVLNPGFAALEPLEPRLLLSGTIYEVNTLADTLPLNGNDEFLTLREAIEAANTNATLGDIPAGSSTESDIITFAPSLFTQGPATITLNSTELQITDSLNITGPTQQTLAINANALSRVFLFQDTHNNSQLNNLTITSGTQGIRIYDGILTINNAIITQNFLNNGEGGAINARDTNLTINNSKIFNNYAQEAGGGIQIYDGTLTINNTTISGNTTGYSGGGIRSSSSITTINNSTVTHNTVTIREGGGITNDNSGSGSLTLNNSIVALNTAPANPDIYNYVGNTFTDNTSLISIDPLFISNPSPGDDTLWNTPDDEPGDLHLQPNSPAINEGDNSLILPGTLDLDNNPRIHDNTVDIGAYEAQINSAGRINITLEESTEPITSFNFPTRYFYANSTTQSFLVHNIGNGTLTVDQALGLEAPFSINRPNTPDSFDDWTIQPGELTVFNIIFQPSTPGLFSNTLTLTSDDPNQPTLEIPIQAQAISPAGAIDVTLPDGLPDAHTYDFGDTLASESASVVLTVHNTFDGDLTVNLADGLTAPFSLSTINGPDAADDWIIAPGATHNFTVNFDSSIPGQHTSTLNLLNSDLNQPNYPITFTARHSPNSVHYVVNSLLDVIADDGKITLREAIEAANTNTDVSADVFGGSTFEPDQITFNHAALAAEANVDLNTPLTITLNGEQLKITDDLSIQGLGAQLLTIDANALSRVFKTASKKAEVQISDLTLTGGNMSYGAGFHNQSATLTLTDMLITNNSSLYSGGGIYNSTTTGSVTLVNSTISNNEVRVSEDGAGIRNIGILTIINSIITGNNAITSDGGGIKNTGTLTITDSTISNNIAKRSGGGIYNIGGGTITLSNSIITGNSTLEYYGAGIYTTGSLTISNSTLSNNHADRSGGAIYNTSAGTTTLNNSVLSGNTARHYGGGIYINSSSTVIANNSTLSNNTARIDGGGVYNRGTFILNNSAISNNSTINEDSDGGGIYNYGSSNSTLTNSTVSGNTANHFGGGIYSSLNTTTTINNSTITANHAESAGGIHNPALTFVLNNTIVARNTATSYPDINSTNTAATNNNSLITNDPLFIRNPSDGGDGWIDDPTTPDYDESANNDLGDLRLQPDSPAINTGDNNLIPPNTPYDITGAPRIYNNTVDIGAYEYIPTTPSLPGDINGDQLTNTTDTDLISTAINTQNTHPHYDLNNDQQITPADGQFLITSLLNKNIADTNFDNKVNIADLITWAQNFGKSSALFSQGDSNFDGKINIADLILWAQNFGKSTPPPITAPLATTPYLYDSPTPTTQIPTSNFLTPAPESNPWNNITSLINKNKSTASTLNLIQQLP